MDETPEEAQKRERRSAPSLRRAVEKLGWKWINRESVAVACERRLLIGPRELTIRGGVSITIPPELSPRRGRAESGRRDRRSDDGALRAHDGAYSGQDSERARRCRIEPGLRALLVLYRARRRAPRAHASLSRAREPSPRRPRGSGTRSLVLSRRLHDARAALRIFRRPDEFGQDARRDGGLERGAERDLSRAAASARARNLRAAQ